MAMTDRASAIAERVHRLRAELPPHVRLIAVTKYAEIPDVQAAIAAGVTDIGENRVQEARRKHGIMLAGAAAGPAPGSPSVAWHLIGHLQTNKVRQAVGLFDVIQSLDSRRLVAAVDEESGRLGKRQEVYLQVNTSGEASKHGFTPGDAAAEWPAIQQLPHLRVTGLMTIAPARAAEGELRACFRKLRELRDRLAAGLPDGLPWLSMGMTDDYRLAVEEGANVVRIGRLIFATP